MVLVLHPSSSLPWRLVQDVARVVFPPSACRVSRPRHALRRRRPRLCPPHSSFWTEIDSVCLSGLPTVPPLLRAPTSVPAARHRCRAFPPGQPSAPPSGAAPGPSFRFRLSPFLCFDKNKRLAAHPNKDPITQNNRPRLLSGRRKADTNAWWEEEEGQKYTKKHFDIQKIAKYFRTSSPVSAADI